MFKIQTLNSKDWENKENLQHFGITYWGTNKSLHLDFGNYSIQLNWSYKNV